MNKKSIFKFTTVTVFFMIVAGMLIFNPITSMACGFGNSGGSDFVPQRQQTPYGGNQAATAIDQNQVRNIVKQHVTKLNPDLAIGDINDAGGFFEVEVLNQSNEVLQMLGVDKFSGRLMLLN
jgi:hypothetical protein